jgi:DNA-binding GntR family transcriptional regulator
MIFANEIRPGTHLIERKLAEKLDTSRVPIREALQRLVLEGILVYVPGKGLVTRTYDEHELLDLYHYREPLEGMASRLYCQRADDTELTLLGQLYTGMERQAGEGNVAALNRNDFEFHLAIARGSRNNRLINELTDIYQECHYVTKTSFTPKSTELPEAEAVTMRNDMLGEHRSLYEALIRRDADAAERAARVSVRSGLERFMRLFAAERVKSVGR